MYNEHCCLFFFPFLITGIFCTVYVWSIYFEACFGFNTGFFSFSSFFIHLQQREEAIMEDQKRALRRYNERKAVADFQNLQ